MRTRTTPPTQVSPTWQTSSGTNPGEDFEEELSIELDTEIPRGSRTPTGGLLPGKGVPRSPIGLEVGKSAGGGLGIGVSVPIGGPINARGGINIGKGGAITGGQVGLGIGAGPIGASIDVGIDADKQGRGGCYQYVTVTVGPFSHTYGRNVCEPKSSPAPTSTPTSTPTPTSTGGTNWERPILPVGDPNKYCRIIFAVQYSNKEINNDGSLRYTHEYTSSGTYSPGTNVTSESLNATQEIISNYPYGIPATNPQIYLNTGGFWGYDERQELSLFNRIVNTSSPPNGIYQPSGIIQGVAGRENKVYDYLNKFYQNYTLNYLYFRIERKVTYTIIYSDCSLPSPSPTPSPSPSPSPTPSPSPSPNIHNPPPRKKMNDKCCRTVTLLLLMLHKHHGVTPLPGMESLNPEVTPKGETFYGEQMAFPFEVPKRWLDPLAKKEEKILVKNVSQLLFIMGSQSERLERVLGTTEFYKDSDKKLRQSEDNMISWLTGKNNEFKYPDPNDFWGNTDDGIINEKTLEVCSIADGLRYQVEALNRLERILPIAELKDSSIPARWVYPKGKGQLRVGNLIHLVEYMFRADDRARGFWPQTVRVKDSNPAIPGDQPIELKFESQADMLREILKFLIDTEGDGDLTNNFALRSAIQQCQIHQGVIQTQSMVDAIVEYLDFKVNRTTTKIPMPFSPFAGHEPNLFDRLLTKLGFGNKQIPGSIDKNTEKAIESLFEGILQNTEVEVPIIEAQEKKTLNEALMEILKHASASSAAVSERVGEGALKRLVESAGIAQSISRFLLKKDIAESNGIGDLDQWISSAEKGYTDKPETDSLRFPESDPLEPYDRPIAQNPKIREIDTKDPKAD